MPEVGEDIDDADRVAALADRHRDAWEATLEDTEGLAAQRREQGYETLVIPAGDTAPQAPDHGEYDRFGLVHVIPGNFADDFETLTDGDFSAYDCYRAESDGRVFLVTELLQEPEDGEETDGDADDAGEAETVDADDGTADGSATDRVAVYVVGTYELRHAGDLIETAVERSLMYTHLERLDGSHVASVVHEDPEKFFPHVDRFVDDEE